MNTKRSKRPPMAKPRLTHFLALPLGHHPALRASATRLTDALLASAPAIPGLDPSIVIPPRRLHLTLGVMSLAPAPASRGTSVPAGSGGPGEADATLPAALALLHTLRPRVRALLAGAPLRAPLGALGIMPPERGDPARAHVLWLGPTEGPAASEDVLRLRAVCELLRGEFMRAGLMVDERRPLKLHCTLLNTVYRKPRGAARRTPFSFPALLASAAVRSIAVSPGADSATPAGAASARKDAPLSVDMGVWAVDEVQICEMGSWGPEGEYVSAGGISLRD